MVSLHVSCQEAVALSLCHCPASPAPFSRAVGMDWAACRVLSAGQSQERRRPCKWSWKGKGCAWVSPFTALAGVGPWLGVLGGRS